MNQPQLDRWVARASQVTDEIRKVYIGPPDRIERLLVALLARGHVLVEGVPGVAKTTLVRVFAATLGCTFSRIQFTPDLLPADITGTFILNQKTMDFVIRRGPIFANVILADEINRAPAKTQSALLEAMQEMQVTIEGASQKLAPPFMLLATQNPVEYEGVYPLPEAQIDRFMMKIVLPYPTREEESSILMTHGSQPPPVTALLAPEEILAWQEVVKAVHVKDELRDYIVLLSEYTRNHSRVALGASPRASLTLLHAAKARASLQGRDFILPDDVKDLALPVLSHRILLTPEAELDGYGPEQVVQEALGRVRYRGK